MSALSKNQLNSYGFIFPGEHFDFPAIAFTSVLRHTFPIAPMQNLVVFMSNGASPWAPAPRGLPRLCACLTWFDDEQGSSIEPWKFLESFLKQMAPILGHSMPVRAIYLERKRARLFSGYREHVLRAEPAITALERWRNNSETQFPDRLEFGPEDHVACTIETEFWSAGGGPAPYHDSVTLSFYTSELSLDNIRTAARAAAADCGAVFEEKNSA